MDKDKERKDDRILRPSAQEAIGDAAKANVEAAIEVASSAVTAFVDALVKPRPAKGRKALSKKKTVAPRPGKSRTSARKSASATGTRKVARTGAKNPTRKASKPARSAVLRLVPPKLGVVWDVHLRGSLFLLERAKWEETPRPKNPGARPKGLPQDSHPLR